MGRYSEYNAETRRAYQDVERARAYKAQHSEDLTWARFMMWRERTLVKKILGRLHLKSTDRVLDIPCGTGVLGQTLSRLSCYVFASDIASEMMDLAREDYYFDQFQGFAQADIMNPPFAPQTFDCVITIGLLHRLQGDIRRCVIKEIALLSNQYLIVSNTIDSPVQVWKRKIIKFFRSSHSFAPSPVASTTLRQEFLSERLKIISMHRPFPVLSGEVVFLLEKSK